jgi:sirohydrochlorin ferrochelatase
MANRIIVVPAFFGEQQATAKNIPHALAKWWPIRYNG